MPLLERTVVNRRQGQPSWFSGLCRSGEYRSALSNSNSRNSPKYPSTLPGISYLPSYISWESAKTWSRSANTTNQTSPAKNPRSDFKILPRASISKPDLPAISMQRRK